MEIPKLYRTKTIRLGEIEVEIKGHRAGDFPVLKQISKNESEAMKLTLKLARISTIKDKDGKVKDKSDLDLTDKDVTELLKLRENIEDIKESTRPLIRQLAIRGVKRFYYPDKNSEELDNISDEDFEINEGDILLIHQAMNELDLPLSGDEGEGKSKRKK